MKAQETTIKFNVRKKQEENLPRMILEQEWNTLSKIFSSSIWKADQLKI